MSDLINNVICIAFADKMNIVDCREATTMLSPLVQGVILALLEIGNGCDIFKLILAAEPILPNKLFVGG